jgi:hypothetical protein
MKESWEQARELCSDGRRKSRRRRNILAQTAGFFSNGIVISQKTSPVQPTGRTCLPAHSQSCVDMKQVRSLDHDQFAKHLVFKTFVQCGAALRRERTSAKSAANAAEVELQTDRPLDASPYPEVVLAMHVSACFYRVISSPIRRLLSLTTVPLGTQT